MLDNYNTGSNLLGYGSVTRVIDPSSVQSGISDFFKVSWVFSDVSQRALHPVRIYRDSVYVFRGNAFLFHRFFTFRYRFYALRQG